MGAQTACEDLARAVSFIFVHAQELEVETEKMILKLAVGSGTF